MMTPTFPCDRHHPPSTCLKKFKKIYIEITNRCNLSCSFCLPGKRPKAWMLPEEFGGIVRQVKDHTQHVALHVLGEPLLHPDLDQLLASCRSNGLAVNLTTNGTLLAKRQPLLLASPALRQINISLHSAVEAGSDASLGSYLAEIFAFIRAATSQTPLLISLRLWNMSKSGLAATAGQNDRILQQLEAFFGLPSPLADRLTPGHGTPLAPRVFLSQNPRFTWPHNPAPEMGSEGFCRGLRDHVAILVDGTVVPCCLDAEADIPLGNIHRQPLGEILASPRATQIYQGFSQRRLVEPLCRRCTFRQSF